MNLRIAYLPGDGIGPEVLAVARHVLDAAGFRADWVELPVGWDEWCRSGDPLPAPTLDALRGTQAALFGAITSKGDSDAERELAPHLRGRGLRYQSPILRLRQEFDLYANVRPVVSHPGNPMNVAPNVNVVIFRENTEGFYKGIEAQPFPEELRRAWQEAGAKDLPAAGPDTAVSLRVTTRAATERIVRRAFAYAAQQGRRKVTLIEKANVLRATGGLVRSVFADVGRAFPEIQSEELNVDAACAQVVRAPETFDVVVATNLFGDIFSDVAAEVAGGLPLAASGNVGDSYALFEPVHGSAPGIAGLGIANPLGAVLAGAMLARHAGQEAVASRVEASVRRFIAAGVGLPRDLGGRAGTHEVERNLIEGLPLTRAAT